MLDGLVDAVVAAKLLVVGREHDLVLSAPVGPDAVVGEGLGRMEVEDEEEVPSLEDDDLVGLWGSAANVVKTGR